MCTVTFIPKAKSGFVLTSNRDEAPNRISLPPEVYDINGVKTLFPKDKLAGGSWIGASQKNRVLCLLNGGFIRHKRKDHYAKSRGVVVKDLLTSDDIEVIISDYNMKDVEPFTLVIVDWNNGLKLFELVWDGLQKHFKELPLSPQIWSSSTLYSEAMKHERQQWFNDFLSENENPSKAIIDFHTYFDNKNLEYGIIMDRKFVKTTSVTQINKDNSIVSMEFNDLKRRTITSNSFETLQTLHE